LAGEWLSEVEYRAAGYMPDFDSLPVLVVRRLSSPRLVDIDALPPDEQEELKNYLERHKNA